MSHRFEQHLTGVAIGCTLLASVLFGQQLWERIHDALSHSDYIIAAAGVVFVFVTGYLIYGSLVYQETRLGYFRRMRQHTETAWEQLASLYTPSAPALTMLVPSYKEDHRIIRQTLFSAALQEYPHKQLVLLIDDPPHPASQTDRAGLEAARGLPEELRAILSPMAECVQSARAAFHQRQAAGLLDLSQEHLTLAAVYEEVARWLEKLAANAVIEDHTDRWFVELVFRQPSRRYEALAKRLRVEASDANTQTFEALIRGYHHLTAVFDVKISSFERKGFRNFSHEPNKAMNLNAYLGLMGTTVKQEATPAGLMLHKCLPDAEARQIPDAKYVITLDADSLLVSDYATRLIHFMEQPANSQVAVIQTPYSAIPGAPGTLERCAGATTDIQYLVHQGFTQYNATFWVGANALLRKAALEEIAITDERQGFPVTRYIQDHTVIEDTESTMDLILKGWRLHNHPARLAYSATPSDFGALLIQRGRWANGGLLILPKLFRYLCSRPYEIRKFAEILVRFQYLSSLAGANLALLIILGFPSSAALTSVWLVLTALPYYGLYARDMWHAGYRPLDVMRVYALNLLLLPVHLGGVFKSLQQAWTGRKIPFRRTPKVTGRTSAPAGCLMAEYLFVGFCVVSAAMDGLAGRIASGLFAFANGAVLLYAIHRFIGFRESWEDLCAAPALASWQAPWRSRVLAGSYGIPAAGKSAATSLAFVLCLYSGPVYGAGDLLAAASSEAVTEVALTFDDLPAHGDLPSDTTRLSLMENIIQTLKDSQVQDVVGFANGNHLDYEPKDIEVLQRWVDAGFLLGNHTYHHRDLSRVAVAEFLADVDLQEALLQPLIGSGPGLFRFPYLHEGESIEKRTAVHQYLEAKRYTVVPVTVDYNDWAWTNAYMRCYRQQDAEAIAWLRQHVVQAALRQLHRSQLLARNLLGRDIRHVMLLHVGVFDSLTLREVLTAFSQDGVRFISVQTALEDPVYRFNPGLPINEHITFLEQLLLMQGRSDPYRDPLYRVSELGEVCTAKY
jgi:cellulose synthase (UDP-forming)